MAKKKEIVLSSAEPMMASFGSSETSTRRNRGATIERTDKYANIQSGTLPFKFADSNGSMMDVREVTLLCQKAYFNIAVVRNIIDLMTEFSVGDIYFRKGSKAGRDFQLALWEKNNLKSFQDKFYREYFRSGNVPIVRFDATIQSSDISKITQTFGAEIDVEKMKIPAKYIILNPSDIKFAGNISFAMGQYFKMFSDYELARLKNPKTDEDKETFNALPPETRKLIQKGGIGQVYLPLDPERVTFIFYKKQDYEPFAAPMILPVLEDLEYKAELKKLDMAIARTQQQVILLVTTGTKPEEGGVNQNNITTLQRLFGNESIGRVLVADYTTTAKFVIPEIGTILNPEKYQIVNEDINMGLNNILVGGEKFANQGAKVEVFLARLNHAREVFLNEFLIPEIKRISRSLGFKNYPIPYYEDIALKNNDLRDRIYTRLFELGVLTPSEVITALETNRLPDKEASLESQTEFKTFKDKELYVSPLAKEDPAAAATGRPPANSKGVPQTTKKITPAKAEETYSASKLINTVKASNKLFKNVESYIKLKNKKKTLNEEQRNLVTRVAEVIIANEKIEDWDSKIAEYYEKPIDTNFKNIENIKEIAAHHDADMYLSSLLLHSKNDIQIPEPLG